MIDRSFIDTVLKREWLLLRRASYNSSFQSFCSESENSVLGKLSKNQGGDVTLSQTNAWKLQIQVLRKALKNFPHGTLLFEFLIPRMGKRADNVLIIDNAVFVLEFKVGAEAYDRGAITQVVDYALDLKNFHAGSKKVTIFPILVATKADDRPNTANLAVDRVGNAQCTNGDTLSIAIEQSLASARGEMIDVETWINAGYQPTPTIVEASQALFRGHNVEEISRSEAGADNLGATSDALNSIIDRAKANDEKAICLVTGVPGAGKTLAGLNLACERRRVDLNDTEHAVFLSGNGPLVQVLQEALARDEVSQLKSQGLAANKSNAHRSVKAFVQIVHHFRDECIRNDAPPTERVVIFDEAQRAWTLHQTAKFMRQKKGYDDFSMSEPAFLISAMNRHDSWAVIVCLVGGGQEINTGEAGMEEWLIALQDHFPNWNVYVPDDIDTTTYLPSFDTKSLSHRLSRVPGLHLGVSLRSFRSEQVSSAIHSMLESAQTTTQALLSEVASSYPIIATRSLATAKRWLMSQARGSERFGLLASSGARRLKPLGITPSGVKGDVCNWFLNDRDDVRSSYYLEDAASEFEIQGLELDWTCLVWGADFIRNGEDWISRRFRGTRWEVIRNTQDQLYRLNAYRVLLTRARQGMIIVVPEGDERDETRSPKYYDPTWEYLTSLGIPEL